MGELLVQPQPVWKKQPPSFNGTAFFLKTGDRLMLLSSAHYLESEVKAINFWSMQGEPLLQQRYSLWGFEDHGVDGAIQDLSSDLVAMPVPSLPQGYVALDLDTRRYIAPGERVWLPNKQEGNPGHQRVEGRITDWDPGYVDVELDHPIEFHSQSGSPVLSANSGKVIGVVSRVGGTSLVRLTPLWVVGNFLSLLSGRGGEQQLLAEETLPVTATESVTPSFHWPDADWPLITMQSRGGEPHVSTQTLHVKSDADGLLHINSTAGTMDLFSLTITKDGADVSPLAFTEPFRGVVKSANHIDDANADAFLKGYGQTMRGMFRNFSSNWSGQSLAIGTDYTRDLEVEISGVPAKLTEVFQATRAGGCKREIVRRCVMIKLRREYGAAEVARVQAELRLKGSQEQIGDVRYLASVDFEIDGMVPHGFMMTNVIYRAPDQTALTLNAIKHPSPKAAKKAAPTSGAQGVGARLQPALPSETPLPEPRALSTGSLATLRAGARPLVVSGPGPESTPVPAPAGAQEMVYSSGALQLRGWLAKPNAATAAPLVVYLHDGFSPTQADWAAATEFLNKGYGVFVPQLRGEAGNPGDFSAFLHEVDDVVAAGTAAISVPGVDAKRLYLVGRGNGAALALLVAELPNPFAAVAALAPTDTTRLAFQRPLQMPFDTSDVLELTLRDPLQFLGDLQVKTLILTPGDADRTAAFCAKAAQGRCRIGRLAGSAAANAQAAITAWQ